MCDKCISEKENELKHMTLREYRNLINSRKMSNCRFSDRIRYLNRTWNKNLLKSPCQYCGYVRHTELSHKKAISEFSEDTQLSVVNSSKNNIVLCPTHQWEYDNGFISFEDILNKNTPYRT